MEDHSFRFVWMHSSPGTMERKHFLWKISHSSSNLFFTLSFSLSLPHRFLPLSFSLLLFSFISFLFSPLFLSLCHSLSPSLTFHLVYNLVSPRTYLELWELLRCYQSLVLLPSNGNMMPHGYTLLLMPFSNYIFYIFVNRSSIFNLFWKRSKIAIARLVQSWKQ